MPTGIAPINYEHKFPLPVVMTAFWNKFPHPAQPGVLSVKTVEERTDPSTNITHKTRLFVVQNTAPWIFRKILTHDTLDIEEKSQWNPQTNTLTINSVNRTFASVLKVEEESHFSVHPQNKNWTAFRQDGRATAGWLFGPLRGPVERFISPTMRKHGVHACEILDKKLHDEYPSMKFPMHASFTD